MRATRSRGWLGLTVRLAAGEAAAGPHPGARIGTPQAAGHDDRPGQAVR
jgi:hypothetical protein